MPPSLSSNVSTGIRIYDYGKRAQRASIVIKTWLPSTSAASSDRLFEIAEWFHGERHPAAKD
jgi:hypothetical protein